MDFLSYHSSLLLFFVLLLAKLLISSRSRRTNLPPGPWQLPLIGSTHHMAGSLPHRRLRDLAKIHGPVMHLNLGEVSTVVVSSADAAREFMKTHDLTFSTRPLILVAKIISYGGRSLIFAPYGEFWRQVRKICVLELLSAKRVQSFRSIREEEVLNLVRSVASAPSSTVVNLSERLNLLTNDITVRTVVGDKCKDQATFLLALNESVEAAGGFDLTDLFPSSTIVNFISGKRVKLERIHRKLDAILDSIIQGHKIHREGKAMEEQDLLDVLLRLQAGGDLDVPLTDDNIKAVILDIFGAGSETSSTTLTWAMTELVRNPRAMKKAQIEVRGVVERNGKLTEDHMDELSYMRLVIKESMRLHVPAPLLAPRECRKTCEVLGYQIPEKTWLLVNAWAMGRDSRYWGDDAEEFRPERFDGSLVDFKGTNFEFIPFGAGRRMCPGISYGMANVELPLAHLICYFDWEIPGNVDPSDLDMDETFGATARKKQDLRLHAIPRIPCP